MSISFTSVHWNGILRVVVVVANYDKKELDLLKESNFFIFFLHMVMVFCFLNIFAVLLGRETKSEIILRYPPPSPPLSWSYWPGKGRRM